MGGLFDKGHVAGIAPVMFGRVSDQPVEGTRPGGRTEVVDMIAILGQEPAQCFGTVEQFVGLFGNACPHYGVSVSFDHAIGGDAYGTVVGDRQVEDVDCGGHDNHGYDSFLMRHFVVAVSPVGAGAPA